MDAPRGIGAYDAVRLEEEKMLGRGELVVNPGRSEESADGYVVRNGSVS